MRSLLSSMLCLALATAVPAASQTTTAELTGSVTDPSGAAIGKVRVTAINTGTGLSHEAVTDDAGNYLITQLPPGTYNLSAEASGFRKTVQNNTTLEVSQRARVDFKMQLGQVSETVEVAAAPPLLESQSSTLGNVVTERLVGDLPLNGRNFLTLAILTPGVNGTGFSTGGTIQSGTRPDDRRPGSELFSNGNREGDNNFLYDGVDNNERLYYLDCPPAGGRSRERNSRCRRACTRPTQAATRVRWSTWSPSPEPTSSTGALSSFCATPRWTRGASSTPKALSSLVQLQSVRVFSRRTSLPSQSLQWQEPHVLLRGLRGLPAHQLEHALHFGAHCRHARW